MFAPTNFGRARGDYAHVVTKQPSSTEEIEQSRAALAACPVAAIRVETQAHRHHRGMADLTEGEQKLAKQMAISPKVNGLDKPFPRRLSDSAWHVGHHNSKSFGACPYLTCSPGGEWILVDSPKHSKSSVETILEVTAGKPPSYMVLTHVDDTADHQKWKEQFPSIRRIFHSGDLGVHNWIGDTSLERVEILLHETSSDSELQAFSIDGTPLSTEDASELPLVLFHTPGHSPGSISLLSREGEGVLFSGDTLGYTTRTNSLTGFPRYGNNQALQASILDQIKELEWNLVAPGHGHTRLLKTDDEKEAMMKDAKEELLTYSKRR